MNPTAKIYIAGHCGLVGSALMRNLTTPSPSRGEGRGEGEIYTNLLTRTHAELDLTDQTAVEGFFATEKPDYVFLAAAKVGGILANNEYPAAFIRDNLAIQTNTIRVLTLSLVTYHFGDEAGQGFLHDFAGIVLFVSALLLIILVDTLIHKFIQFRQRLQPA